MLLKESMPRDAFTNFYWCLHFADYFDKTKDWSDIFFDKKHVSPASAHHWQKFGKVGDAMNSRWKECVTARLGLTHNESHIVGWNKSKITCGLEPKPIRTGMDFSPHTNFMLVSLMKDTIKKLVFSLMQRHRRDDFFVSCNA
jgi:hypothetical protein